MFENKVKKECRVHNQTARNVRYARSVCVDDFVGCSQGDLLITGGDVTERAKAVAHVVLNIMSDNPQPIVIFSNSQILKEFLMDYAKDDLMGQLIVSDKQYKNYDIFAGMSIETVTNYFCKASEIYRFNVELTTAYAYAFLSIVSRMNGNYLDMRTITEFAGLSQNDFTNDISDSEYQMLMSAVGGASNFKIILANTRQAFSTISNYACSTGFNMTTAAVDAARTIYIHTESMNTNLMRQYFWNEMFSISDRHMTIVFDECIFLNDPEFQAFLSSLKDRANINIIVSAGDNASIINDDFTRNFRRYMVFLGTPTPQLQSLLSNFGEYTHFDPGIGVAAPPTLVPTLVRGHQRHIITYSRARVRLEEESENSIVLVGHNGAEILISKYVTFKI